MSNSGRKIFAKAVGVGLDNDGNNALLVDYTYAPPYPHQGGVVDGGRAIVSMQGRTESEMNSVIQDAVLAACQSETELTQEFVLADITGGRV
jgi:hypothetical protein